MTFGFDIDDTFVNTNKKALEIIEREKLDEGITYYEQLNNLDDFISNHFKEIAKTAELFQGAKEVINWLYTNGHRIIFITSRATQGKADTEEDTIEYLDKNNIKYHAIYLKKHDKLDVCLKEKIDVFIDDKESILIPLSRAGITCLKMTSIDKTTSKFITVNNWGEIKKELTKIINNNKKNLQI